MLDNLNVCLHKQKPTCTTWGKPPQSAIWEEIISLIKKNIFVQLKNGSYFIFIQQMHYKLLHL